MSSAVASMDDLEQLPAALSAVIDYEPYAQARLDPAVWAYLTGGAGDECTLLDNLKAFERRKLAGRVLGSVKGGNTQLTLFGHCYDHPVFLAPVAYQNLFHAQGERASVTGAGVMSAGMVVSTLATTSLEALAAQATTPLWFQLYLQARREQTLQLLRRVEAAAYRAVMVTVDAPIAGIRHRERRAGFALPPGMTAVNLSTLPIAGPNADRLETQASLHHPVFDQLMGSAPTWDDIAWLVQATHLPVLIKGLLHPDDARHAKRCGVAGIVVSNHGGRIVDGLPATLEALPAIVAAVEGQLPVLLDGGIRRGGDVFKAIALGASAVLIGRPYIHALATAGALGVAHVLRIFREELEITMALSGCARLSAIGPHCLYENSTSYVTH